MKFIIGMICCLSVCIMLAYNQHVQASQKDTNVFDHELILINPLNSPVYSHSEARNIFFNPHQKVLDVSNVAVNINQRNLNQLICLNSILIDDQPTISIKVLKTNDVVFLSLGDQLLDFEVVDIQRDYADFRMDKKIERLSIAN